MNPLLKPLLDEEGSRAHLRWNMLFSPTQCQRSDEPADRSWSGGRQEPATFPRVTELRLVSRVLPWIIDIPASNPTIGVTCGDIIDQLSRYLHRQLRGSEYSSQPVDQQNALKTAYHFNRSTADGVPGGRLGDGLRRLDWLGMSTMFGGIDRNDAFVREHCGEILPCVFELHCIPRVPSTEEEVEATRRERRRSRSRSAARAS